MQSFTPKYTQPITLEALCQLSPSELTDEVSRLQNSINHLERSNVELEEYCTSPDGEEDAELRSSIEENKVTIAKQEERLQMIRIALQKSLGVDAANSHYTLATSTIPTFRPTAPATMTTTTSTIETPVGLNSVSATSMRGPTGMGDEEEESTARQVGVRVGQDDGHGGMYL